METEFVHKIHNIPSTKNLAMALEFVIPCQTKNFSSLYVKSREV